jgi:hypothetical protein
MQGHGPLRTPLLAGQWLPHALPHRGTVQGDGHTAATAGKAVEGAGGLRDGSPPAGG